MTKIKELSQSRRFAASLAGVALAFGCYHTGMIDAAKATAWIERAMELYVAMIGAEHVAKVARR